MKRITYWALSTVSTLVLLFGYHTSTSGALAVSGSASTQAPITGSAATASTSSGATSSGSNPPTGTGSTSRSTSAKAATSTVTGATAQTRWGPVQVELTIASGKVTDVSVVQYPNDNGRDAEINGYALPVLIRETLDAQSANIDMVSGATVTSDGYLRSLQRALDQAQL